MRLCACVGLLDRDEELMRSVLYHTLADVHCDVWTTGFMSSVPGSSRHIKCHQEYRHAIDVIFAWDWAGSLLAQAVSIKATTGLHRR